MAKLSTFSKTNPYSLSVKDNLSYLRYLDTGSITQNKIEQLQIFHDKNKLPSRAKRLVRKNNIIYSTVRPNQKHYGFIDENIMNVIVSTGFAVIDVNEDIADPYYVYLLLTQEEVTNYLQSIAEQSVTSYPSIKASDIENLEFNLPPIKTQKIISNFIRTLDKKISVNESINKNLEEQLSTIFRSKFANKIEEIKLNGCSSKLEDFIDVIDNRGKTPPLTNDDLSYPIIDVKALSGEDRCINYNNCSKYVSSNTYANWFRNGHPQEKDIIISTVGSLAEMKMFWGKKGCIAQNVVALRSKTNMAFYLYQYLKYIKNDLIAYDIGSVQPSIKVTHIVKHPIYLPKNEDIEYFNCLAEKATSIIRSNNIEKDCLIRIRDSLLPRLLTGEIDVSKIDS